MVFLADHLAGTSRTNVTTTSDNRKQRSMKSTKICTTKSNKTKPWSGRLLLGMCGIDFFYIGSVFEKLNIFFGMSMVQFNLKKMGMGSDIIVIYYSCNSWVGRKDYSITASVFQKSSPPPKSVWNIFNSVRSFCVKFCTFVGSSYPRISADFYTFILRFHQMALIFPRVPIVFTLSSFE